VDSFLYLKKQQFISFAAALVSAGKQQNDFL
jgi:hypothetical protein